MATTTPPYRIMPIYPNSQQPVNPAVSYGMQAGTQSPTYQDILDLLNKKPEITPSGKISSNTQAMLDAMERVATSAAKSTMLRRGMEASTTEGFNVAKAIAEKQAPLYAQDLAYQNQAAIEQARMEQDRLLAAAQLTSDEVASLRNIDIAREQMALENAIAQRTEAIMRENINMSREMAEDQAKNDLYSTLVSGGMNLALAKVLFRGGGAASGGGTAAAGGLMSTPFSLPFTSSLAPSGTAMVNGVPVSTAVYTPGATMTVGTALATTGAGLAGYGAGMSAFKAKRPGEQGAMNVGAMGGTVIGSILGGPAGAGIGSFIGTGVGKLQSRIQQGAEKKFGQTVGSIVKYAQPTTAISSVTRKIKKVFRF